MVQEILLGMGRMDTARGKGVAWRGGGEAGQGVVGTMIGIVERLGWVGTTPKSEAQGRPEDVCTNNPGQAKMAHSVVLLLGMRAWETECHCS